ncbi:RNA polymerase sporulation sigma factor SigH [Halanaerobaculum tunisiense]
MPQPILSSKKYSDYHGLTDDQVVQQAQQGNKVAIEYLLKKYQNFVKAKSNSYFLVGAGRDDIIQEGLIGLYKAIKDYEVQRQASFRSFAELCITRQIITAIKTATRQKHQPLNSYSSLNKPVFNQESDRTLLDILESSELYNPEQTFITNQSYDFLEEKIQEILSDLELEVLEEYLEDKSYQEIANNLDRRVKSVDNALQRIKSKVSDLLEEHNF